jgi:hypothetical protein
MNMIGMSVPESSHYYDILIRFTQVCVVLYMAH